VHRDFLITLYFTCLKEDLEGGGEVLSDCCVGIFLEVLRKDKGIPVIIGTLAAMPAHCLRNESGGRLCYVSLFI